ncbi:MAG: hypothetical protein ABH875_06215, partial [Candidatus Omnitrophota bacterium]
LLDRSGDFVIENYNYAKAFSNFFPGVAGLYGIPMWAFFVNRGQCLSSFGTSDKDSSILEFHPANQAYNLTPINGFRTFIKTDLRQEKTVYEPFRDNASVRNGHLHNRMTINAHSLTLEEENSDLGVKVKVTYMTVPGEPFAGLARRVELTNISKRALEGSMLDGLPHITPYGMNAWLQKNMSRTIEAWITVQNVDKKIPFYALKCNPEDKPELEHFDKGNFYLSYLSSGRHGRLLDVIVDPDIVFGNDGDISFPRLFAEPREFRVPKAQRSEGKMPCAFGHSRFSLKGGESVKIVSVAGNIDTIDKINKRSRIIIKADFFDKKLEANRAMIERLSSGIFTKSGSNEFDFYLRQTFLDNFLRGGYPHSIKTPNGPFVFYLYGRKHGDLERDYNNFNLLPSYFSQGNGAYRDMNQNRRNDIFFNPDVAESNIKVFMDAIQLDGFNPLLLKGASLYMRSGAAAARIVNKYIKREGERKKIKAILREGFAPGDLLLYMERENIKPRRGREHFLTEVLSASSRESVLSPGEGYWIDHWTYNLDLIDNYLALYPEKLRDLLYRKRFFTFFDTWDRVTARSEKNVCLNGKVRRFGSVVEDEQKKAMILSRDRDRHKVRTEHGKGRPYRTSLLVKMFNLMINKMASLDPSGIGIDMEANKPAWCDSLNGLPGIHGSSTSETSELKRLALFLSFCLGSLGLAENEKIMMPEEMAVFTKGLLGLLEEGAKTGLRNNALIYWDKSTSLKEAYRSRVWLGLSGKESGVAIKDLRWFLCLCLKKLDKALLKSVDDKTGMPRTYLFHEAVKYQRIKVKNEQALDSKGRPLVKVLSFKCVPVPYFLEGPVHFMKILDNGQERRRLHNAVRKSSLYDKKLKMYKVNAPLAGMPNELGRSMVFSPGWLENESIFLHMEYKYLLELLRGGLHDEFFKDIRRALVPFLNAETYGRSILENSSFIASSAHPDRDIHGRGFVARLSGSTTEVLSMWIAMTLGENPFRLNEKGSLIAAFEPAIPQWLFTDQESRCRFHFGRNDARVVTIPKDSFAFAFLGKALVTYHNPKRKNTYGKNGVKPEWVILKSAGKRDIEISGGVIPSKYARSLRSGRFSQIEIHLG